MPKAAEPRLDGKAIFYMCLLAVQFGIQPVLTRTFTPPGITRSTVILVQEVLKFVIAFTMMQLSGATRVALKGESKSSRQHTGSFEFWMGEGVCSIIKLNISLGTGVLFRFSIDF
jgi:hypothetical protein